MNEVGGEWEDDLRLDDYVVDEWNIELRINLKILGGFFGEPW